MSAAPATIPYEKQSDPQSSRTCGAACLTMVYRSFGKQVSQTAIWPAIAKANRFGTLSSTTHLMAQDALNRGFKAVAIQARHPLHVLRLCQKGGIRAILSHRLQREAATGHYSVLVGIDDQTVVLHDPFIGPSRRLSHAELLELWLPYFANSEIVGNVLIAVGEAGAPSTTACEFCHVTVPAAFECPRCKNPVGMEPHRPLGCLTFRCIARMWDYICCPKCDYTWNPGPDSFQSAAESSAAHPGVTPVSGPASGTKLPEPDFSRLFTELDKFCSLISSDPLAASDPRLMQQLNFIRASKEGLVTAQAEETAYRKARQAQVDALEAETEQRAEAQRKKMEELNKPSAPLDGDALGCALLKNLGFIK